jgi:predicted DsbA family dithiol-disulfide isomerase
MALKIQMFSDFICPFCYIGFEVMRQLKPEFGFELEWRGFQIHPEWPAEGIAPEKVRSLGDMNARQAAWHRISEMAEAAGLEMKPPAVFTNSRSALAAAEFAREYDKADAFAGRVYRAYFGEDANIGDVAVLTKLGAEVGLDAAALSDAIQSPKYDLRLKNNTLAAHQRGVDGVPTFFIGDYPLVGAQPIDVMRMLLKRAVERFAQ